MRMGQTAIAAAIVLAGANTALAQMLITSVERKVHSRVSWSALIEHYDSETVDLGPNTTDGQWDAIADANPNDPIDYNNRMITAQHSFIGSSVISADLSMDGTTWSVRPSLGYVTLESENVFGFTFAISEPTPVDLEVVHPRFNEQSVPFIYSLRAENGAYLLYGDSGNFTTGESYSGTLDPGNYTFFSRATFLVDGPIDFVFPLDWNATIRMTAVPTPGAAALLAIGGMPCVMRRRRP